MRSKYGDIETLRKFYPGMQRYLDYLDDNAKRYMLDDGLGDWETPTRVTPDQSVPPAMTSTYGYYRLALTVARIAAVLGYSGDAAKASDLAAATGEAFNSRYLDRTNHTYLNGQQAADALALDMGIVPRTSAKPYWTTSSPVSVPRAITQWSGLSGYRRCCASSPLPAGTT